MTAEQPSRAIFDLIPTRNLQEPQIVNCRTTEQGKAFFRPLDGTVFSSTALVRYDDHDAIAFSGTGDSALILLASKGSFIAVEYGTDKPNLKIAFREDTRDLRLSLLGIGIAGEDVTYPSDLETVGLDIDINAAVRFSEEAFGGSPGIKGVEPTWYTEDWVTIRMDGDRWIIVRGDRHSIVGEVMIHNGRMNILNIGDNKLQDFDFKQPPFGKIPASLVK